MVAGLQALVAAAVAAAVAVQGATPTAAAKDPAVEKNLADVGGAMRGKIVLRTERGRLANAATHRFIVEVPNRGDFAVAGVCDDACSDVDIRLLDTDGKVVESDELDDKFPLAQASAPGPVRFQVEVVMKACAKEPCAWGVGVYK
jgi:hypothetical protein